MLCRQLYVLAYTGRSALVFVGVLGKRAAGALDSHLGLHVCRLQVPLPRPEHVCRLPRALEQEVVPCKALSTQREGAQNAPVPCPLAIEAHAPIGFFCIGQKAEGLSTKVRKACACAVELSTPQATLAGK